MALIVFFAIDDTDSIGANLLGPFSFKPIHSSGSRENASKSNVSNQGASNQMVSNQGIGNQKVVRIDYSSMQSQYLQIQYQSQAQSSGSSPTGYTSSEKPEALSVYYQKIRISGLTKKSSYYPSVIRLSVSTKEEINLTGFTIRTRHGEFKIPQGIKKYKAGRGEKDITVDGYINIYIIGGLSPLKTDAFRINTCFGYLKEYNDFYPPFSSYCPKPTIEDVYHLHPYCQDYILKLQSCKTPDYSNDLKISINSYCTSYITENLNYSGCYNNFNKEDDFLKNYWYIYAKSDLVEPLHDIIYLYDQNNYLVDDYSY